MKWLCRLHKTFARKEAHMSKLILDIGAGGSSFARSFRKLNHHIDAMYLCGEPGYKGEWNGKYRNGAIQKIEAFYNRFNLFEECLDVVTLNAFMLALPSGFEDELMRCLKPGGLFFSAHPIGVHPHLPESVFAPVQFEFVPFAGGSLKVIPESTRGFRFERLPGWSLFPRYGVRLQFRGLGELLYPASPTNASRIQWLSRSDRSRRVSGYIYEDCDGPPSLRVWVKL